MITEKQYNQALETIAKYEMQDNKFLTIRQAAKQVDLCEEHTRRLIREGKLKSMPRNPGQKKIYLRSEDVQKYLEGRR